MENNSYKQMMDKVVPSTSLIYKTKRKMKKEDNVLNIRTHATRKPMTAIIAVVVMLSLLTFGVAYAYGSQIIQLLGGGRIESGKTSDCDDYISISTGFATDPVEVRDGQVYFILDGSNMNITSYCTESTFFMHEQIADTGYRHVVIVGGAPDNLGWGEFIWDENGNFTGSNATFHEDINGERPEWLKLAEETLRN